MLTLVPDPIEDFARRHTTPLGPLFERLTGETQEKMDLPQMQVGPLEGGFLRMLVRLVGARRVLEVGTFTGYSALAMAEGLPDDGELVTLDRDPTATGIANKFWAMSPHGRKIRLVLGDATQTIRKQKGPFDLVFLDADKENYLVYYEVAMDLLRPGGLLIADNTLWSGRVLDPKDATDRAIVAFDRRVADDDRVENVLLTVRDGMMLARKR